MLLLLVIFAGFRKTCFLNARPAGFWGFIGFWALLIFWIFLFEGEVGKRVGRFSSSAKLLFRFASQYFRLSKKGNL